MTPSKILFYFCISFIVGIFFESVIAIPQIFLWIFLFLEVVLIIFSVIPAKAGIHDLNAKRGFRVKPGMTIIGFCGMFLLLGILRVQISEFNIANDKLSKLNDKEKIELAGVVIAEPDLRDTFQKIKVKINESTVLVTTSRYPEYKYLDKIKLIGKLETPIVTDDFNYKNYLMKDHIYSVMEFPKIEMVKEKENHTVFTFIYEKILFLKQKIRESIKSNFSPPESSILEGTILGDSGAMSNDLKNKLNITGLRHIIAVSGTHVVILCAIIMPFLLFLGLYRGQAFYIAIIIICFYILLTGLPSSGVRAGIMGGLYLLAQKLGRQSMGSRVIAMACAVMLLINPLLLVYDVGFQLSFLAVLGLIFLEPFIKRFVKFSIVSTTLAAQVFTLPIMVYNFGNISYVSPLTNFLISPIVSPLMILGFLASFAGIFSNILGQIFSLPCWIFLIYFVKIIDFFSQPWAMGIIKNVHWVWLLISYLSIGLFVRFLKMRYNKII